MTIMSTLTANGVCESDGIQSNDSDLSTSSISVDARMPESVDEFKSFMYQMQDARRKIVSAVIHEKDVDENLIDQLKHVHNQLTDESTAEFQREMTVSGNNKFSVNVKDEIVGLEKDISYLENLIFAKRDNNLATLGDARKHVNLAEILSPFHPISHQKFMDETESCTRFLRLFIQSYDDTGKKPILITDWDGTMKDYCSQYATNLQPTYSAIGMANFAKNFTRLSAVLTAGPLRGPGILDLTSLPIDGPILFSGSWGREWWMSGKRLVHNEDIPLEGDAALRRFKEEMEELLSSSEYSQFGLVGSGVQSKVDRLTLGVQTVFNHVDPELSENYQDAIRERMHRVDPDEQILHFDPSTELEVEVVVHNDGTVWNKADGVSMVIEKCGDTLEGPGKVLICGDTASDLPMVEFAVTQNPTGAMALFVTMKEELCEKVRKIVSAEEHRCFVSCPDVIHAAMDNIIKENALNSTPA
uniref:Trehalose-6-phosphate phosphatase helical bundle domain-containing protein n=1 Tax=Panagrolaimus superbus TaxID=310955 RepID=A0A914YHK5_9BILA